MNIGPEIIACLEKRFEVTHYFESDELEELRDIKDAETFWSFCKKTNKEELIGISDSSAICDQLRDIEALKKLKKVKRWWITDLLTEGPLSLIFNSANKKLFSSQIRKIEERMENRRQLTTIPATEQVGAG